jgi:hypothetical protein
MELKKEIESALGVLTSDLDNLMQKRTVGLKCLLILDQPIKAIVCCEKDI